MNKAPGAAAFYVVRAFLLALGLSAPAVAVFAAADASVRYIDFDSGDDAGPGTRDAPWKHHPWDTSAAAVSASTRGIQAYIFKRGVTYRGLLEADESGTKAVPVQLTTEAGWGEGPAVLSGSEAYSDGWSRCPENVSVLLPAVSRRKAWCRPVKLSDAPRLLWQVNGSVVSRIPIARTPNWNSVDPDDPRSEWYELDDVIVEQPAQGGSDTHTTVRHLVDRTNLTAKDANAYKGATVWAERRSMPKADAAIVTAFDPATRSLATNFHRHVGAGPRPHDRYFMEGLPAFLDSAGEYVFLSSGKNTGMLVIRLEQDRNPNTSIVEVATRQVVLKIQNQSHIEISGLSFRYANQVAPGDGRSRHAAMFASAVQVTGDVTDVSIKNCDFSWLATGVTAFPENRESASVVDGITITGSRFSNIDGAAIALSNGQGHYKLKKNGSRLIHVTLQNNSLKDIGYRTLGHFGAGSHGNGITVEGGEVVDVSGNQIDRTWGSGISVTLGSDFKRGQIARPFLRGLIHDNRIIDSLLGSQDGGGINAWMGGPAYIYNNISGNPVGCMYSRHKTSARKNWYRRGCFGVGIYLDGQYKGYVFNNILWGKNNNANDRIYNSVGLNEAMGFMHTVFNNTFYRFATGLHKGMHQHNRNYYLANLFIDMGLGYIEQEPKQGTIDYATLAFTRNQFYGKTAGFGKLGSKAYKDLDSWRGAMRGHKLMRYDTGTMIAGQPVNNAEQHDFMPTKGSPAIDAGVRTFVPWALYGVVGEWHFLRRNDDPSIINGENINMNAEWVRRDMFDRIPRNNLQCRNTGATDFQPGLLEDWIPGALRFDGKSRYCGLSQPGVTQESFDMGANSFLIELVIAPNPGASGVLAKHGKRGYSLSIDADGRVRFNLDYGSGYSQRVSSRPVDDSKWHHVLVEVDRSRREGISIYLDGKPANGEWSGVLMQETPVSNNADFEVGRSGNTWLSGSLDFLRISRGTLADAETNIDELYKWQFDGPFLRDITGQSATGARRDVGAVEYRPN